MAEPYILYEQLHQKGPIHRMQLLDARALTKYEWADRPALSACLLYITTIP